VTYAYSHVPDPIHVKYTNDLQLSHTLCIWHAVKNKTQLNAVMADGDAGDTSRRIYDVTGFQSCDADECDDAECDGAADHGSLGCTSQLVVQLLNGFGSAVVFTTFSIYVAETVAIGHRCGWTVFGEASTSVSALLALGLGQWLDAQCLAAMVAAATVAMFMAMSRMPETPQHLLEHGRVDEAHRSLNWRRGAPAEMEFAVLQVQLDDHPSHKVIANCSSSLQCNWFLI